MVIVFLPALEGLRPQWREAAVNLGATTWQYWPRVAVPLLRPAFLGASLLLFANAFAAYATAAALVSQGNPIVPLLIRAALTSEVLLGQAEPRLRPGLPDDRGRGRGHDRVRAAGPAYVEVVAVKPSYTWRVTRVALLLLFGAVLPRPPARDARLQHPRPRGRPER